jgi:hypothetical protein
MRRSLRFSILLALAGFALAGAPSAQQAPRKKPITHDVYDAWKSIQGTKISRDGAWVAYALVPQDGDGELVVRNLKTNVEYRAPRGRDPVITPDGKFVVFSKSPLKADVDKARKARGGAASGGRGRGGDGDNSGPRAGVGAINLANGEVTTFAEHVKSFKLPEEPVGFVAYLTQPEGQAGGAGGAGRAGGNTTARTLAAFRIVP